LNEKKWLDETVEKIVQKMDWVSDKNQDKIPYTTDTNGNYDDRADHSKDWNIDDGTNWWTNGFWGGLMWLMSLQTGDEKYAAYALKNEEKLEQCFKDFYGLHHDVGFMFQPTSITSYRLTGNFNSRKNAMIAANLLAGRFNPNGFIRAWNDLPNEDTRGWAIIDCLFNLPLLYWATEECGDPRFKEIAMIHADKAMESFVRPDGSVVHIVEFDPLTGEMVKTYGGQGYQEGSSWTRGQAWALYGFTLSYVKTGKIQYLETAKKVAHYCMANFTDEYIVLCDFRQPAEIKLEDSCAAAVMAGGLLLISDQLDELEREMYRKTAIKILQALSEKRADWSQESDAILQNCTGAYHHQDSHHISMVYADYYFVEAIFKLTGQEFSIW